VTGTNVEAICVYAIMAHMAKKKTSVSGRSGTRTRLNPLTGEVETVPGTKAGKKRTRLPEGHPLRTHDLRKR
jgi:hypothetical protein